MDDTGAGCLGSTLYPPGMANLVPNSWRGELAPTSTASCLRWMARATGAVVSRNLTDDMLLTSGSRSNVVLLIVPRRYGRLSVSNCDMATE